MPLQKMREFLVVRGIRRDGVQRDGRLGETKFRTSDRAPRYILINSGIILSNLCLRKRIFNFFMQCRPLPEIVPLDSSYCAYFMTLFL
jgi:hypothetical protein